MAPIAEVVTTDSKTTAIATTGPADVERCAKSAHCSGVAAAISI